MPLLTEIPFTTVELRWHSPLPGLGSLRARQLRGAIAQAFPADSHFHQHDTQGQLLYRYPLIQYRWRQGYGLITGWHQVAVMLLNLAWLDLPLQLGEDSVWVSEAIINTQAAQFGSSEYLLHYDFFTPVLLFNQENYKKYKQFDSLIQRYERDRLLRAQLLTALRGVGVEFNAQLYAAFAQAETTSCRYKNQTMIGLVGGFVANVLLPEDFAIGHAVSHGYGWITRI